MLSQVKYTEKAEKVTEKRNISFQGLVMTAHGLYVCFKKCIDKTFHYNLNGNSL